MFNARPWLAVYTLWTIIKSHSTQPKAAHVYMHSKNLNNCQNECEQFMEKNCPLNQIGVFYLDLICGSSTSSQKPFLNNFLSGFDMRTLLNNTRGVDLKNSISRGGEGMGGALLSRHTTQTF